MILEEVKNLYKIITLNEIRRTNKVKFDALDLDQIPKADGFERVIHESGAISPGTVGDVVRPWYMHPHQEDNLMVLHGTRYIEIFTPEHGKIETFTVTPNIKFAEVMKFVIQGLQCLYGQEMFFIE